MTIRTAGRVQAMARPGAMPQPAQQKVSAFTKADVFDQWGKDAAGIRAAATSDNVITMFDIIGEDFWSGGGVTAKGVRQRLQAIGPNPVEVQINSPGGDMFEGIAIYNVLREHPAAVTIKVMGMAASAASIIAMAGDDVQIGAASFLMIHNCWVMAIGNRHDMAETAEWLGPFDEAMRDVYAARSGATTEQVGQWMDAETYFSGNQAITAGLADSLLAADQMIEDDGAKAADRALNDVRAMELTLCAAGMTRSSARERIQSLKGTPGAAPNATPGAGLEAEVAALIATLKG